MTDNFSIQINIPVKNYVFKYLTVKYGEGVVKASRNTVIGSIILSMLSGNGDVKPSNDIRESNSFKVIVTEYQYLRNGVFIDNRTVKVFNQLVDSMLKEELYCHMIINKFTHDSQYMDCVRNFLSVYDITEDDLKLESVYRDFKRKRDAIRERMQLKMNT